MRPFRRCTGPLVVLFSGCALAFCAGCGVTIPVANGSSGTTGGTPAPAQSQASISIQPTTLTFGSVVLNTTATQPITVSSTGNATLQITALGASGSGFALSTPPSLPLSLAPGQSATLYVTFTPMVVGDAIGGLSIVSNAANASTSAAALSGTGMTKAWSVQLTWSPPANGNTIVGYDVFRAVSGTGAFTQLNASPIPVTMYSDPGVSTGNWDYVVRSVDVSGAVSGPSNVFTVAIP
jgi:hypothetical protein